MTQEKHAQLKSQAAQAARKRRSNPKIAEAERLRSHERNVKHGYSRAYYQKNKDRILAAQKKRVAGLYASNPQYKWANRIRTTVNRGIQGIYSDDFLFEQIGCYRDTLINHLKSKLKPGMVWEDRKTWHVDHIVPLAAFDLSLPDQRKRAQHYTNLQLLTKSENSIKATKIPVDMNNATVNALEA